MTEFAIWTPAYVGIGSNLDDPRAQVEQALQALANVRDTQLIARSKLYRSTPLGPQDQPEFVNAAAGLLTLLDASSLLRELQAIEQSMGRTPPKLRWGPRVIDLDLLMHGAEQRNSSELNLPHPGLLERNFVLCPLADIAPELEIRGHGRIRELAERVGYAGLRVLHD